MSERDMQMSNCSIKQDPPQELRYVKKYILSEEEKQHLLIEFKNLLCKAVTAQHELVALGDLQVGHAAKAVADGAVDPALVCALR